MNTKRNSRKRVATAFLAAFLSLSVIVLARAAEQDDVQRIRLEVEKIETGEELSFWQKIGQYLKTSLTQAPPPGSRYRVSASAYSSSVDQTDATPCITASGSVVREGIIATNFLPIGTWVRIDDAYFVVEDRMNSRYNNKPYLDIWFPSRDQALLFGRRNLEIEVLGGPPEGLGRDEGAEAQTAIQALTSNFVRLGSLAKTYVLNRAYTPDIDCTQATPVPRRK